MRNKNPRPEQTPRPPSVHLFHAPGYRPDHTVRPTHNTLASPPHSYIRHRKHPYSYLEAPESPATFLPRSSPVDRTLPSAEPAERNYAGPSRDPAARCCFRETAL